jgi:hypothetical protein
METVIQYQNQNREAVLPLLREQLKLLLSYIGDQSGFGRQNMVMAAHEDNFLVDFLFYYKKAVWEMAPHLYVEGFVNFLMTITGSLDKWQLFELNEWSADRQKTPSYFFEDEDEYIFEMNGYPGDDKICLLTENGGRILEEYEKGMPYEPLYGLLPERPIFVPGKFLSPHWFDCNDFLKYCMNAAD